MTEPQKPKIGRPPLPEGKARRARFELDLSADEKIKLKRLGGSKFIQAVLAREK